MAISAATTISRTYDSTLSSTAARVVEKKFKDQVSDEYPTLWFFMANNLRTQKPMLPRSRKGKVTVPGGQSIRVNVRTALNNTPKYLQSSFEQANTTPQQNQTLAQFEFRQILTSVTISDFELLQNQMSDTRIANILDEKIENANTSTMDFMSSQGIFSDGTASANNQITGLQAHVSTTGTLGQINRTTNTFWRSNSITSGSFAVNGLKNMAIQTNNTTRGRRHIDLLVTTQAVYEFYENNVIDQKRYVTDDIADASFGFFRFKGVPLIFDRDCPSGKMYFLNSNVVYWVAMKGGDVRMKPFVDATVNGQAARISIIHTVGNLISTEPRLLGELTGITA